MSYMRSLILFFIVTAGFILLFALSCSSNREKITPPEEETFEIKESELVQNFEKESKAVTVLVKTNLKESEWSVTSHAEWCSVTKSEDAVTLRVQASEEPEIRSTTVDVHSSIQDYTFQISQLGYGPAILVKTSSLSVKAEGDHVAIAVTANVPYKAEIGRNADWLQTATKPESRAFTDYTEYYTADANNAFSDRTAQIFFTDTRNTEELADTVIVTLVQQGKGGSVSEVVVEGDIKLQPTGAQASEWQTGNEIRYAFDGDTGPSRHYHSDWYNTQLPVTLEFFFENNREDMDYILYYPRSGNGNFGEFDLYIATEEDGEYRKYGSYNFKMQNAVGRIVFEESLKAVTKVKFVVKTGLGGFVSCAEMEFYRKNTEKTLDAMLLTVFKDITCTELRSDASQEAIDRLPGYFSFLATAMRDNTYDEYEKEFRIGMYKPYSVPEEWAEKLMTRNYSSLDNPTGITVENGDSLIILVGDCHGQQISLQNVGEENTGEYVQTAAGGDSYILQEGVNKIGIRQTGMLFVVYTTDLSSPHAQPVKIHIPLGSGKVNGYFDLERHKSNDRYKDLIDKSAYKYFCVKGDKIIFYFHREQMKQAVPYDILSALHLWDDIVGWQHELMGIEEVRPAVMNNHLFAISPEGSYMWASDYRIAFVYTYLDNILLKENVMAAKDNAWGPAHEIGHIHQRAINWPSSTESSNNLFSNYTLYKLGKYCSRGSALGELATARLLNHQAWYNMGDATHQNESTEIHMRMNWQLWNYYHRCGYKPDFWQRLFKLLREERITESDPGAGQLLFARKACEAANEDLTDFFDMWGFFVPVDNVSYSQYGTWNYNVTEQMIADTKAYMARFPKAKHAFYYLEDRKRGDVGLDVEPGDVGYYTQFKEDRKITKEVRYSLSGSQVTIHDGEEAVCFEVKDADGTLVWFSNFLTFDVPSALSSRVDKIYAVQADGTRILLTNKE